jgi:hypothetical protein
MYDLTVSKSREAQALSIASKTSKPFSDPIFISTEPLPPFDGGIQLQGSVLHEESNKSVINIVIKFFIINCF